MLLRWFVVLVRAFVLASCGGGVPKVGEGGVPKVGCGQPGSDTDMSKDPDYVSYVRGWTNAQGCAVRRDVIAMREHGGCYPDNIREILIGTPLGEPTTPQTTRIYVRDPDGAAHGAFGTAPLRRNIALPPGARDSGYRFGDLALWILPDDPQYVYVVSPDGVEAWPLAQPLYGCG